MRIFQIKGVIHTDTDSPKYERNTWYDRMIFIVPLKKLVFVELKNNIVFMSPPDLI